MTKPVDHRPGRRQQLGRLGEHLAVRYLQEHGYEIRTTNYRCAVGEIDIVARDGECLVFVEVRTRQCPEFGLPEESVDHRKLHKLVDLAETYLQQHEEDAGPCRIDVVAISLSPSGELRRLEHIQNVIS